jgi:hypothetical protein
VVTDAVTAMAPDTGTLTGRRRLFPASPDDMEEAATP